MRVCRIFHNFLFGNDGYTVSSTVQEIESGISVRAADRATGDSYVEPEETYDWTGDTGTTGTTDWGTGTGTAERTGLAVPAERPTGEPERNRRHGYRNR